MNTFVLHANHPGRANVLANLIAFLGKLPIAKSWQIEVKAFVKTRSTEQNNALFGVAYKAIMEAQGLSGQREKDQLHLDMCCLYWGEKEGALGRPRPKRTTTTDERGNRSVLTTKECLDFYAFIQRTAAEYGIYVPDPDPLWKDKR